MTLAELGPKHHLIPTPVRKIERQLKGEIILE
jgi:hypothetical protein